MVLQAGQGGDNPSCQQVTPRLGRGAATTQADVSQRESPGCAGPSKGAVARTNLAAHASSAPGEETRF